MRTDLLPLLCCPVCRSDLTLSARRKSGDDVIDGELRCSKCAVDYPIADGIPDLLPADERG